MEAVTYAVRFDWPEGGFAYAGLYQGAFGWAPTLQTAELYDAEDKAHRVLENAYGSLSKYGRVVQVKDGGVV